MKRILIAEDDANLGMVLSSYLTMKGYSTRLCNSGKDAYDEFQKGGYDMLLIDVTIPMNEGVLLVENIRKVNPNIPLFFMSVKNIQDEAIRELILNADDYIMKPFEMDELLMRVRSLLRRTVYDTTDNEQQIFQIGEYVFDNNVQQLLHNDVITKLTTKESALLHVLCEKMGKVVDRTYILNSVWKKNDSCNARSMDVYITKLRKFLKDDPNVNLLNIHGIGFKLAVSDIRNYKLNA